MAWETVAEGISIWDLETIGDFEMPKGTRMRIVMETPLSWLFDLAGAEWAFAPFVPDNMKLIDVWGESGQGIVELEVTGTWFLAALAFMKAHWLALTIAGFVVGTIVTFIVIMVKVPAVGRIPVWLILGAAGGILLLTYVGARGRAPPR